MEAGADMRRRSSGREEDDEELQRRRQLQEEQLMKVVISLSSCCFWTPPQKRPFVFCKQLLLTLDQLYFIDFTGVFLIAICSSTLVWDNWYWKKRWKRRVVIDQPFLPVVMILQVIHVGNKADNEQWIVNTTYTHIKQLPRIETTGKTAWYVYMLYSPLKEWPNSLAGFGGGRILMAVSFLEEIWGWGFSGNFEERDFLI